MRQLFHLALAVLVLVLAGCGKKEEVYAPPEYRSWARTTDVVLDYPIPGHEDHLRIPRMNARGFEARPKLVDGKPSWNFPEGTVIVKEVYASSKPAPGEEPIQLTIMVKEASDKESQAGWLWLTKSLPGGEETVFTGNFCVTCHANANEAHPYGDHNPDEDFRDYVYFVPGEVAADAPEKY
jgi:hypothetical protein